MRWAPLSTVGKKIPGSMVNLVNQEWLRAYSEGHKKPRSSKKLQGLLVSIKVCVHDSAIIFIYSRLKVHNLKQKLNKSHNKKKHTKKNTQQKNQIKATPKSPSHKDITTPVFPQWTDNLWS